jgi:hypothetical protein
MTNVSHIVTVSANQGTYGEKKKHGPEDHLAYYTYRV